MSLERWLLLVGIICIVFVAWQIVCAAMDQYEQAWRMREQSRVMRRERARARRTGRVAS